MKVFAACVALALAGAAPLGAQQPAGRDSARHQHQMMGQGAMRQGMTHGPMMMGMDSIMGPMMRAMAFAPEHLLQRKDSLRLTAEQERQVAQLRDSAQPVHDAAMAAARGHGREALHAMSRSTPDAGAVGVHFRAMHSAMGDAHWAMLETALRAKAVLTDAQRAQVESWSGAGRMP